MDERILLPIQKLFPDFHTVENEQQSDVRLFLDPDAAATPEGYALHITANGITLQAPKAAGLFYALQTLRQIIQQAGRVLPCLEIQDAPVFPFRGYLLDISRGRIPRMNMLKRRIRLLAALKINHLQLYTEHTFQFAFDPDIAADGDALSADDIRELDAYCHDRFIELTPCLTCFGHMGKILSLPAYRALAEIEFPADSWSASTWRQRMRGATLYTRDPRSSALLQKMLDEYLPLFRSPRFNLCGDETYDLGQRIPGTSADEKAAQYAAHLHHLHDLAAAHGKTLMMWGDMLLQHPPIIPDLPDCTEVLDWAYFPSNRFEKCHTFLDRGIPTIVCPSVRGFGTVFNNTPEAQTVIHAYAKIGQQSGARGMLNTDWGDYGHFNTPPAGLHGLAWGAALSWTNESWISVDTFREAFARIVLGADTPTAADIFIEAGSAPALSTWPLPAIHHTPLPPPENPVSFIQAAEHWEHQFRQLQPKAWITQDDINQLALACRFIQFNARVAANEAPDTLLSLLDELERAYTPLWFHESLPLGLLDIHHRGFTPMRNALGQL